MTKIIAEIGINHNGSLEKLFKLVNVAKNSGADYVKIQTYIPENVMISNMKSAPYQKNNLKGKKKIFDIIKKNQISFDDHFKIKNYCRNKKIKFLSSPFDIQSVKFLYEKLKLKEIKIPSGEINNFQILDYLSKKKVKVILSTGMSTYPEIKNAIKILKKKKSDLIILQCTTSYPAPYEQVNLNAMLSIKKKFKYDVGLSDHTTDDLSAILASSLGAKIIEKHITLSNKMSGPDHQASLNPQNFKDFVIKIKNIPLVMGSHKKRITKNERANIKFARKSIYAKKKINIGEKFTEDNLILLRPGVGISPDKIKNLINKKSPKNFKKNQIIKL